MKQFFCSSLLIILSSTLLVSAPANATAVQWTLQNVTFNDGATASGVFTYDADLNIYSAINISTTAGSILGGANYYGYFLDIPQTNMSLGATSFSVNTTANFPFFGLRFATGLTNLGGSVNLLAGVYNLPPPQGSWETVCVVDGICIDPSFQVRLVTGGAVTASVVPIPAAIWLLGSGLGVLGWTARMKRRAV